MGFRVECVQVTRLFCSSNVNYPYCYAARERVAFANRSVAGAWHSKLFTRPKASGFACRPANREVAHATNFSVFDFLVGVSGGPSEHEGSGHSGARRDAA